MKNFLYKFEFFSGFYESYFYRNIKAKTEKDAIIQIVSFFKEIEENKAIEFLENDLGKFWRVKKFWKKLDMRFNNADETVGYSLIWLKEL